MSRDSAEAFAERLRAREWQVLESGARAGAWNMGLDWALLEEAAAGPLPPTLRLYGWNPPALSLGRFQDLDGVDLGALRERGWELVRRPTGGRAVLHHRELTYSLVLPPDVVEGVGVRSSYSVLGRLVNNGLRSLLPQRPPAAAPECAGGRSREPNCFALASECDSLAEGGKLVGSAQVRHGGALLQHGSILLDADRGAWRDVLGSEGRLATLADLLGAAPPPALVRDALLGALRDEGLRLSEAATGPRLEARAEALAGRFSLDPSLRTH